MIHFLPSACQRATDAACSFCFDSVRHAKSDSLRRSHSDVTRSPMSLSSSYVRFSARSKFGLVESVDHTIGDDSATGGIVVSIGVSRAEGLPSVHPTPANVKPAVTNVRSFIVVILSDPTVELTRRREFTNAEPDQLSYETRSRRSRPTICSALVERRG
jgi:hypothetical protein